MTAITEQSTYPSEVPLIEVGDEVKGGAEGAANKQAVVLAARTKYLKDQVEQVPTKIVAAVKEHAETPDPHPQYLSQQKANTLYLTLEGANLPGGSVLLDSTGKIPANFLNFVKTTYKVVADKTARLALAKSDDLQIIVQQDEDRLYYLNGTADPAVDANWFKGQSATVNGVASTFGRTGAITAEVGDYNADQITETANRTFITPAERVSWGQKQATLVSGVNIVSLFGKPLLGSGNFAPTPADMGAAAASHKHPISDVTDLDKYVQGTVNTSLEAGSGVSIGVNPKTNKLTLSVNQTAAETPQYTTVDRTGSVAGQSHDFTFNKTTKWGLEAFALKRVAGLTGQGLRFDTFTAGILTDYKLTPHLTNTANMGATLITKPNVSQVDNFYKTGSVSLSDLSSIQVDTGAPTDSIVPALTSNTSAAGYVASASGQRDYTGKDSEAPFRAFDGLGTKDWFANGTNGQWLRIDLPQAALVSSYSIKNRPGGAQSLASWYLQGSNDGGTTWTNLHTGSNTSTAGNYLGTYTVPASTQGMYKSYRIYVLSSNGGNYSSVSQWKLFQPTGKALLKGDDGNWYKIASSVLSQVAAPTSSADFDANGFSTTGLTPISQFSGLKSFEVYNYSPAAPSVSVIPQPQIAIPATQRGATIFGAITNIAANTTVAGTGVVKLALTKDNSEFFVFKNSAWVSIGKLTADTTGANQLNNNGNTVAEITALTQANIEAFFNSDYSKFGIAYGFSYGAITDTATVNYLQITGNLVDTWQYQTPAEVVINRRPDGITFKTVAAGDYKLCYQIP